ncbi:MAG: hypothetical protein ACWGNI_00090 [Desulfobacterales bacterium]
MLRCYPISDKWLTTQSEDAPEYCDIMEIRNDPHGNVHQPDNVLHGAPDYPSSAYLTWVLANDPRVFTLMDGSTPTRMDHIRAASFEDEAIRIGDTDNGNNVRGILKNNTIITVGEYFGGVNYDEVYRRIYRDGTEVEKFWFIGN